MARTNKKAPRTFAYLVDDGRPLGHMIYCRASTERRARIACRIKAEREAGGVPVRLYYRGVTRPAHRCTRRVTPTCRRKK